MTSKTYIGIDPGQSGGIAFIGEQKSAVKMPETRKDLIDLIYAIKGTHDSDCIAVVEKVGAMPGQGVSSTFKFGQNFERCHMALIAAGIPYREATPQKWLKHYGLKKKPGETGTKWKNRLKEKAQQLFPDIKVTLATADALLIANYCKEVCH